MRQALRYFDNTITNFITSWPTWLELPFVIITTLGGPVVTLGIGASVVIWGYLSTNMRLAFSGIAIWATLGVGALIKLLIGRERPATEYAANISLDTMSFPSGHTSGSTVAYGLLAYIAWSTLPQPWNYITVIILAILIVAIGISRIYLGAHYPSDVVAGWILGGVVLCIILFIVRPLI